MNEQQKKIQRIVSRHGGVPRKIGRQGYRAIAKLTFRCEVTYGDVVAVIGPVGLGEVYRAEVHVDREWRTKEFKRKGCVDYSHRLGVEMARESA